MQRSPPNLAMVSQHTSVNALLQLFLVTFLQPRPRQVKDDEDHETWIHLNIKVVKKLTKFAIIVVGFRNGVM